MVRQARAAPHSDTARACQRLRCGATHDADRPDAQQITASACADANHIYARYILGNISFVKVPTSHEHDFASTTRLCDGRPARCDAPEQRNTAGTSSIVHSRAAQSTSRHATKHATGTLSRALAITIASHHRAQSGARGADGCSRGRPCSIHARGTRSWTWPVAPRGRAHGPRDRRLSLSTAPVTVALAAEAALGSRRRGDCSDGLRTFPSDMTLTVASESTPSNTR
jgi:hypothetical protein